MKEFLSWGNPWKNSWSNSWKNFWKKLLKNFWSIPWNKSWKGPNSWRISTSNIWRNSSMSFRSYSKIICRNCTRNFRRNPCRNSWSNPKKNSVRNLRKNYLKNHWCYAERNLEMFSCRNSKKNFTPDDFFNELKWRITGKKRITCNRTPKKSRQNRPNRKIEIFGRISGVILRRTFEKFSEGILGRITVAILVRIPGEIMHINSAVISDIVSREILERISGGTLAIIPGGVWNKYCSDSWKNPWRNHLMKSWRNR